MTNYQLEKLAKEAIASYADPLGDDLEQAITKALKKVRQLAFKEAIEVASFSGCQGNMFNGLMDSLDRKAKQR